MVLIISNYAYRPLNTCLCSEVQSKQRAILDYDSGFWQVSHSCNCLITPLAWHIHHGQN